MLYDALWLVVVVLLSVCLFVCLPVSGSLFAFQSACHTHTLSHPSALLNECECVYLWVCACVGCACMCLGIQMYMFTISCKFLLLNV